jgi:uncharacterized protein YbaA (DUF1428 family)
MPYVDGFVFVVSKKNISAYTKMAQEAGKVWKKHGALAYKECIGDDVHHNMHTMPFDMKRMSYAGFKTIVDL